MADSETRKVDSALQAMGLSGARTTDPRIVSQALSEMKLRDLQTQYEPIQRFLADATTRPLAVDEYLTKVSRPLTDKYPMITEFLDIALRKNWLKPT